MLDLGTAVDGHGIDNLHVVAGDEFLFAMVWLAALGKLVRPVHPVDAEVDVGLGMGSDFKNARYPVLLFVAGGDGTAKGDGVMVDVDIVAYAKVFGSDLEVVRIGLGRRERVDGDLPTNWRYFLRLSHSALGLTFQTASSGIRSRSTSCFPGLVAFSPSGTAGGRCGVFGTVLARRVFEKPGMFLLAFFNLTRSMVNACSEWYSSGVVSRAGFEAFEALDFDFAGALDLPVLAFFRGGPEGVVEGGDPEMVEAGLSSSAWACSTDSEGVASSSTSSSSCSSSVGSAAEVVVGSSGSVAEGVGSLDSAGAGELDGALFNMVEYSSSSGSGVSVRGAGTLRIAAVRSEEAPEVLFRFGGIVVYRKVVF